MAVVSRPPRFVVDAHALWWYIMARERLSHAAANVFRLAEQGRASLIVPAIVVAELYYLSVKLGEPLMPSSLLTELAPTIGLELSVLGQDQLELLPLLTEIPEMHDRLIAAAAMDLDAAVVTRDPDLFASPQVATVW